MRKELAHGERREARDAGRNETRQSGLNDRENKVAVPTWNAKHYAIIRCGPAPIAAASLLFIISPIAISRIAALVPFRQAENSWPVLKVVKIAQRQQPGERRL
jgi:hypothetical protein